MHILQLIAPLALRQLIGGACRAIGVTAGQEAVAGVTSFLSRHFTDQSERITKALQNANERAWKALEISLAGESWWDRCTTALAAGDERAFRQQVRDFLNAMPLAGLPEHGPEFNQECLRQLRAARKAGLMNGGLLNPDGLAQQAGAFARFTSPQSLMEAERAAMESAGVELSRQGYPALARFLSLQPQQGPSLLVIAVGYFFRREVEADAELARGLAFAQMETLGHAQEAGFGALADALAQNANRLESLLSGVKATVALTHGAVLDVQAELRLFGSRHSDLYDEVIRLQGKLDLLHSELRPRDSLSIHSPAEREIVKRLVGRYRNLPEAQRRGLPALLNAIGKLEVAAGNFSDAAQDFDTVAAQVDDPGAKAEAHRNAYNVAIECRHWGKALDELRHAIALGGPLFAPFPAEKYEAERILGAGGFGVVFLCRNRYSNARVVVKALRTDALERDLGAVFEEATALEQLQHSGIIRLRDCGCVDGDTARPYLVMDYFEGPTLEQYVRERGPLAEADFILVARQIAEGLNVAHSQDVLHRDVKPGNVLLRRVAGRWEIKLIDFGLCLRKQTVQHTVNSSEAMCRTLLGGTIAGTIDYAAPEQMGRLPGVPVGEQADIYGFGKTCCFALFGTPQPGPKHWRQTDDHLAELLGDCVAEHPNDRPLNCEVVIERLKGNCQPDAVPARAQLPQPARQLHALQQGLENASVRYRNRVERLLKEGGLREAGVASLGRLGENLGLSSEAVAEIERQILNGRTKEQHIAACWDRGEFFREPAKPSPPMPVVVPSLSDTPVIEHQSTPKPPSTSGSEESMADFFRRFPFMWVVGLVIVLWALRSIGCLPADFKIPGIDRRRGARPADLGLAVQAMSAYPRGGQDHHRDVEIPVQITRCFFWTTTRMETHEVSRDINVTVNRAGTTMEFSAWLLLPMLVVGVMCFYME